VFAHGVSDGITYDFVEEFIVLFVVDAVAFTLQLLQQDIFFEVDPLLLSQLEVVVGFLLFHVDAEFLGELLVYLAEHGLAVVHDVLVALGELCAGGVEEPQILLENQHFLAQHRDL